MLFVGDAGAQWKTQQFLLKPGWTAIYLNVDASHETLGTLIGNDPGNPIDEVWMWQPSPSTLQFIDDPQIPTGTGAQWASWKRPLGPTSVLQRLVPNAAFLVNNTNSTDFVWSIKGKPVIPVNDWTSEGINFIGFPTPEVNPPVFANFFGPAPNLLTAEVYHYPGGALDGSNPMQLFTQNTSPVTRGQAYWVRSGQNFNRYFGPFELSAPDNDGVNFGPGDKQVLLRLKNITSATRTVTISLLASEAAPTNHAAIVGAVPVLLRGDLNTATLAYDYHNLSDGSQNIVLQPAGQVGSEAEVIIGVNRTLLTGAPGDVYAGILRFTDDQGLQQVDLSVSATVQDTRGLWVGGAAVNQVRAYLKSFQKDSEGALITSTNSTNYGAYVVTSVNTNLGGVVEPFPLRMIIHNNAAGNAVLMQRVFYGLRQATNQVLTTEQSVLDQDRLDVARRISAAHLPFQAQNTPWAFTGQMTPGMNLTTTVSLAYDDQASNPFLHTYHPDHDNLDASASNKLAQGAESYRVDRKIVLSFQSPTDDFASLAAGNQELGGNYAEEVTLYGTAGESRKYEVSGAFELKRVSPIDTLTLPE